MEIFSKILATSFIIGSICFFVVNGLKDEGNERIVNMFGAVAVICFITGVVSLLSLIWLS